MAARTYTMRKRAEAKEAKRGDLLDATRALFIERLDPDSITLEQVALRAGTSTMTVIRHFGTKKGLLEATRQREHGRVMASRRAPAGDIDRAIHNLYRHYEETGDWGLRMQALESVNPGLRKGMRHARKAHREWVEEVFAPQLEAIALADRTDIVTALVVACDLLTWKLLRRDLHLPRSRAESIVRRMAQALLTRGV